MSTFTSIVHQLSPLYLAAKTDLETELKTKTVEKGDFVFKQGMVCRHIYFVEKGLVKLSFQGDRTEFIMRFFPENNLLTVIDSLFTQTPSNYSIVALEPSEIVCIEQQALELLCRKHFCIELFYRKLLAFASTNMMKRVSEMLEEDATKRYENFVSTSGHLLQRIQLGDLANYLGIAQVSLSRIRSKK